MKNAICRYHGCICLIKAKILKEKKKERKKETVSRQIPWQHCLHLRIRGLAEIIPDEPENSSNTCYFSPHPGSIGQM